MGYPQRTGGFIVKKKRNTPYTDVKTVESWRNEYIAEEYPEGPYGSATNEDELGKSSPFLASQHASPRFTYENREFHQGLQRPAPNAHPTHDEEGRSKEVSDNTEE